MDYPMEKLRLGVNIDHVATIRNARGGRHPDPVRAARLAAQAGADGITAHLREDRRHIGDDDIVRLAGEIDLPLNLEMAPTEEMLAIALRHRPHACCLVPERREERTTEGGLDVAVHHRVLEPLIRKLGDAGIRVAVFVEAATVQLAVAKAMGAHVVEINTGSYCDAEPLARADALRRIVAAAAYARDIGLECHAGHGLTYDTVGPIAAILPIVELNIGHFLVGEAIFGGLESSIKRMRAAMDQARNAAAGVRSA
jgi:pyridoxine 5-phosphate synthase